MQMDTLFFHMWKIRGILLFENTFYSTPRGHQLYDQFTNNLSEKGRKILFYKTFPSYMQLKWKGERDRFQILKNFYRSATTHSNYQEHRSNVQLLLPEFKEESDFLFDSV